LILLGPRFWPWFTGGGPERGSTLFGVRVPSDFADSEAGRKIRQTFRRRVWIGIFALAGIFAVAAPSLPSVMSLWYLGAVLATWLTRWIFYWVAQRRTSIEAGPAREPSVRTATLLSEGPRPPRGIEIAAWTVMIMPVAVPLITSVLLVWNWAKYPARLHPERIPAQIAMAGCFGLLMTVTLYALRYHARVNDWAATPEASLKYRTYLGLMMGTGSLAPILGLCALALGPLYGARMGIIWFGVAFSVLLVLLRFVYRLRSKLAKLFDPQSGDPMADDCWKWTSFYYNPSDPAWIVPRRSGIGCSLNHARATVWVVYGIATACYLLAFLQIAHFVPDLIRTETALEKQLH
jgi:uncharacterized membrane protein